MQAPASIRRGAMLRPTSTAGCCPQGMRTPYQAIACIPRSAPRDVRLQATRGQRPVEPSKAVLQKLSVSHGCHLRPMPTGVDFLDAAVNRLGDGGAVRSTDQPSAVRLRVAVDVDEVLGRFVYALNLFCLDHYGMKYDVQDYWIYEFAKIWNCSQEQSNHIVHEFFKSQHFNSGIPVIPGAYDVLNRLGISCDLVVVTSRQHVIQDVTLEWIDRHYEGLFQEVYFGNHFALEGVSRKKSEICKSIGARVLIDDNPGYAMECARAGIHVLLYDWNDSYPWSKIPQEKMHPLITVVRNWQEVEQAVEVLSPRLANLEQLA